MGVYKWAPSARFRADAQRIGEEIESLDEITPANIVEIAEDESTELHKCFTWDDAKAAHLYRLDEARSIVKWIIAIDESPDRKPVEYRAFESVIIDQQRQYVPTRVALSDEDMRAQVMSEIAESIAQLSRKAKAYRSLAAKELDTAQHHLDLAREAVTA